MIAHVGLFQEAHEQCVDQSLLGVVSGHETVLPCTHFKQSCLLDDSGVNQVSQGLAHQHNLWQFLG